MVAYGENSLQHGTFVNPIRNEIELCYCFCHEMIRCHHYGHVWNSNVSQVDKFTV